MAERRENYCIDCKHMTVERHEDYMGQPMWYLGECAKGLERYLDVPECASYEKGAPTRKDCRCPRDIKRPEYEMDPFGIAGRRIDKHESTEEIESVHKENTNV